MVLDLSRETVCNDLINSGVAAALIGGFAFESMMSFDETDDTSMGLAIYFLAYLAVHACTCSTLTSCILYREVNLMPEENVPGWYQRHPILVSLPFSKFAFGCICYLFSVLLISVRDLEDTGSLQVIAIIIGGGSMSMVFATMAVVYFQRQGEAGEKLTCAASKQ